MVGQALRLVYWSNKFQCYRTGKGFRWLQSLNDVSGVLAIVGKERLGKSSLCRYLHPSIKFGVGHTQQGCTKGLWIWTEQFPADDCLYVVVDCEGIYSGDTPVTNHDSNLMLWLALISSDFMYKIKGSIDETNLAQLELVLQLAERVKAKADQEEEKEKEKERDKEGKRGKGVKQKEKEKSFKRKLETRKYFDRFERLRELQPFIAPRLYLVCGDWTLQNTHATADEYFESKLAEVEDTHFETSKSKKHKLSSSSSSSSTSSVSPSSSSSSTGPVPAVTTSGEGKSPHTITNSIKRAIKLCFPERHCFLLPRPLSEELLPEMGELDHKDPRWHPKWVEECSRLRQILKSRMRPKQYHNKPLSGPQLASSLRSFVEAVNNNAVPVMEDQITMLEAIGSAPVLRSCEEAANALFQQLRDMMLQNKLTFLHTHLQKGVQNYKEYVVQDFQTKIGQSFGGSNSTSSESSFRSLVALLDSRISATEALNLELIMSRGQQSRAWLEENMQQEIRKLSTADLCVWFPDEEEQQRELGCLSPSGKPSTSLSLPLLSTGSSGAPTSTTHTSMGAGVGVESSRLFQVWNFASYLPFQQQCLNNQESCFSAIMKKGLPTLPPTPTLPMQAQAQAQQILCPITHSFYTRSVETLFQPLLSTLFETLARDCWRTRGYHQQDIEHAQMELKTTQTQHEEDSRKLKHLSEELEASGRRALEAQEEVARKMTTMTALFKTKDQDLTKLMDQVDQQRIVISELESTNKDAKETIESYESRAKEHEQQLDTSLRACKSFEQQLLQQQAEAEEAVQGLSSQIVQQRGLCEQAWASGKRREEELLFAQREEKEASQRAKDQLVQKVAELEELVKKMERDMEAKKGELMKITGELKSLEAERDELLTATKTTTRETTQQISTLTSRLSSVEAKLEKTKTQLAERTAAYEEANRRAVGMFSSTSSAAAPSPIGGTRTTGIPPSTPSPTPTSVGGGFSPYSPLSFLSNKFQTQNGTSLSSISSPLSAIPSTGSLGTLGSLNNFPGSSYLSSFSQSYRGQLPSSTSGGSGPTESKKPSQDFAFPPFMRNGWQLQSQTQSQPQYQSQSPLQTQTQMQHRGEGSYHPQSYASGMTGSGSGAGSGSGIGSGIGGGSGVSSPTTPPSALGDMPPLSPASPLRQRH